ncbi:MAG: FtsX-like permease family protein [Bacteroidetes bacterium]|nr:ABC transporter permease [Rhodothermaceae bacterium RA]RMH60779.1 MAG: FtsX-like permease family protein [Bacteroidota bacterium]
MNFFEAIRMSVGSLQQNKLRSWLTLLGMVIGVFAIITSVTAVKVIDVYFQERVNFLGSATFTITRTPAVQINDSGGRYRNRRPITYEQVERLKRSLESPVVVSVLEGFRRSSVRYGERETEPNIILLGTDENFLGNYSYELEQGRFLSSQDVHYARPVVVLGSAIAEELFPNETPLGKVIEFDGRRLQVIGVLSSKGSFLGFNQDQRMLAPITYLFGTYGGAQRDLNVSLRAPGVEYLPAAMDEVISRMRVIRKVPPGEDNDFEIETNDAIRSVFESFTGTLTIGGALIGLIALLAAGIGIMNIMLVSVTERTREIGIRKAIGAKRRDILRQFLLEAFFLCQVGGLVGILLGAAVGNGVALYFDISAAFPWGWALAAVVMVTGVSFLFGGYPAFKAARLDPIQSLRYE